MLAFDTETELIAEANLAPNLACLTYSDGQTADIVHWTNSYKASRWLLEQETTAAHAGFDLAVIWRAHPDLRDLIWDALLQGRVHDIIIRQKLMDIGAGIFRRVFRRMPGEEKVRPLHYGLSDLHARYFGAFLEKDQWRLRYGELRPLPLEQWPQGAKNYALLDPTVTSRIHTAQDEAAAETDKHNLWDEAHQIRANWALHLMSCWGFATDKAQVEKVIGQIDEEQPALQARLRTVNLVRPKGGKEAVRNEKLAKKMMYEAVGDSGELTQTGYKRVKAGEMSKEQALQAGYIKIDEEWCKASGYKALEDYYHFRQNQLLRAKLGHIHHAAIYSLPVQTEFEPIMETGRTSSRENKLISNSMALQNPPRKGGLRECFVSREGWTLVACDYGQAELVSLAQVTFSAFGYSKMRDLLNAGQDIHVDFGSQIMAVKTGQHIDYAQAWAMHKAKGGLPDPMTGKIVTMKDMRQAAKSCDFGFPGGLGWASFQSYARKAWGVEITGDQSKQLKINWLRHFPEMKDYFRWIGKLVADGRADIQQFMSQRWRGKCFYTQACNCLDDKTEALTQRGWVKGFDLVPGDKLLTKNMKTGVLEWESASRIQKYPLYEGPLTEFKTKNFSALTTPEHRWLVNNKKEGLAVCKTTTEIGSNGDYRIHRTGDYAGPATSAYTDDFVELVGWVLTDGSITKTGNKISVYQSQRANPAKVKKIDALFERMGLSPNRWLDKRTEGLRWTLSGKCSLVSLFQKMFPGRLLTVEFLHQLTRKQLELLWTTMMLGDGTCNGKPTLSRKGRQQHFTTKTKAGADVFQHLCTLIGFASQAKWRDMSKYRNTSSKMTNIAVSKGVWTVAVLRRETVQVVNLKKKYGISKNATKQRRDYVGKARMWCPVVKNTYFVARRDGAVFITGNTLFQGLTADAAKAACWEVSFRCYADPTSPLYGCRPILFVHDEIILEAPEAQAAAAAVELERVMIEVYQRYTPDVLITADAHLMKRWSKDAEAAHDHFGKLIPWEPPEDVDERAENELAEAV